MSELAQRSLAGGELAPALYGRCDLIKYQTGMRRCRNFLVQRHGGVANRAGTRFICEVKDSTRLTRLLRFVFNASQTYGLEFGHLYMRVIKDGFRLEVTDIDAPAWSGATNYVVADLVTQTGIRYYCIAAHVNQIPPNATYWYPLTGDIYEIPTPYVEGDLRKLKYVQSADVVSITHTGYDPRDLSRFGDVRWTLTVKTFAPTQQPPTSPVASNGTAGAIVWRYQVTAVAVETLEESLPTAVFTCTGGAPTSAAPNTLSWVAPSPAPLEYDVYREVIPGNGVYGYIGTAAALAFNDPGIVPNAGVTPPITRNPFSGAGDKPEAVGYYQQRQIFGGSDNNPETTYTSRTGHFPNFTISSPLQSDDAVSFTLAGKQVNRIRAFVDLKKLVIFTDSAEWSIGGDAAGVLRPGEVNPNAESYHGCNESVVPITIGNTAIFLQARGAVVRDLVFDVISEGYKGNDLTLYAVHLFDGHQVVDWDYAQIPNSIIWAVRGDGILLGLTYIRDQAIWGWHRHDTAALGLFESVICVPEGLEDAVYFVVNRIIDGVERRYIEKMESRLIIDLAEDAFFVDSGLSYNGWNDGATTMTVTGGVTWSHEEDLTLIASAPQFVAGDPGNAYVLRNDAGDEIILNVITFTDTTHVTVRAAKTVPVALRNIVTDEWSRAVDMFAGLDHLEGEAVSVLADGNVVADGINEPLFIVMGGQIMLDRPYSIVHIGLPITAEIETLDIDRPEGSTFLNKINIIKDVDLLVESSRGILAGPDEDHLEEFKQRDEEDYGQPTNLVTGMVRVPCDATYGLGGRVLIRQKDPLPLSILMAVPGGMIKGVK